MEHRGPVLKCFEWALRASLLMVLASAGKPAFGALAGGTPPMWENPTQPDRRLWTAATHEALLTEGRALLSSTPAGMDRFCPAYGRLAEDGRLTVWTHLISGVARLESSFRPELEYTESFPDSSGARVVSRGLLQLSLESSRGYGCDIPRAVDLHDPLQNLECGVRVLTRLVTRDETIGTTTAPWKGAPAYWSVFRNKRSQLERWTSEIAECDSSRPPRELTTRAGADLAGLALSRLDAVEIAPDSSFVEARGAILLDAPVFPAYPAATLVGSAELNPPGGPKDGHKLVWATTDSVPEVMRWYGANLRLSGWTYTPPTDRAIVEQVARVSKGPLEGTVVAETASGLTEIIVTLQPPTVAASSERPAAGARVDVDEPSFTFAVAGDFSWGPQFKATAAAVGVANPAFLLALGDLSYDSTEYQWCQHWKNVAGYDRLMLLAGNHDSGEKNGGNINTYVKYCGRAVPTVTGVYGVYYYFDHPAAAPLARFIMVAPGDRGKYLSEKLDYTTGGKGFAFTADAIDSARARNIPWVFVGMHKNYISAMVKDNEISEDAGRSFMTMLLAKRVDVIFQGHEHGYERSRQLALDPATCPVLPVDDFKPACVVDADDDLVKGSGSVIHILGTGGKDTRDLNTKDAEYKYFASAATRTYGFGSFTITPTALRFTFKKTSGEDFADSFTITAPAAPGPDGGP